MKRSNVTKYLEGIEEGAPAIDLRISKELSSQEMTDGLMLTSLILSYSNCLLNVLQNPLSSHGNEVRFCAQLKNNS